VRTNENFESKVREIIAISDIAIFHIINLTLIFIYLLFIIEYTGISPFTSNIVNLVQQIFTTIHIDNLKDNYINLIFNDRL